MGGTDPAQSARKKMYFDCAPPLFGSKSTISRFDERFRDGQYSLVSFLFAVLPLTVPPCPMESAPLLPLEALKNGDSPVMYGGRGAPPRRMVLVSIRDFYPSDICRTGFVINTYAVVLACVRA